MQTDAYRRWSTRIVTFTVSSLAVASAVYWGLKGWSPVTSSTVPAAVLAQASPVTPQAVARALGGGQAKSQSVAQSAAPAISRYVLVGVAAKGSQSGTALISMDGQDAKPVRVGALVDEDVMLQSVTGRRAVLASRNGKNASFTLELPPLEN